MDFDVLLLGKLVGPAVHENDSLLGSAVISLVCSAVD